MKPIVLLFLLNVPFSTTVWASGMALHMFMADKAVQQLDHPELQQMLARHRDFYRIGSVYPDSGYAADHAYGEISHWSDFLNEYQQTLMTRCPLPLETDSCEQAWSHFLGTLAHSYSDMNFDRHFVTEAAAQDFSGDIDEAQRYIDTGCDFLAIMDHKRLIKFPRANLPYAELIETYQAMNVDVQESDIRRGIRTIKLGMVAEPAGAPFAYLYYKLRMKWTAKNYYSARGGVEDTANKLAFTWNYIWNQLRNGNPPFYQSIGGWPRVDFYVDDFRFDLLHDLRFAEINQAI